MHDCARVFLTGETAHTVKKGLLTADCFILGGDLGGGVEERREWETVTGPTNHLKLLAALLATGM